MNWHRVIRSSRFLLLAIMLLVGGPASGEVYKWTGDDGQVHYSDVPPTNGHAKAENVPLEPLPERSDASKAKLEQVRAKAAKDSVRRAESRASELRQRDAEKVAAQRRADRCLAARKQLDVLGQQAPVYRSDSGKLRVRWSNDPYDGGFDYIDDKERARLVVATQLTIESNCEDPWDSDAQQEAVLEQTRDEECELARAEYEVAKNASRETRETIDKKRNKVDEICG